MTVEIIAVGTEILLGNIVNTNSSYLARECAELGLSCYYQEVVGDNEERLREVLQLAAGRSDIVILSGGLGPTKDDLTKEVVADFCKRELKEHGETKERIRQNFEARKKTITDNNWKQAMVPEGAMVLNNNNGTAPGLILQEEGTHFILLPGPPSELVPLFEEQVVPYLKEISPEAITSTMIKICGIGESQVEDTIQDLIASQSNPTIATYAKIGEVHIRVTARAEDAKEAKKLLKPVVKELKDRFKDNIYTTEPDVTLEKAVVDLLIANHMTVTTAESCTGGKISARLVNVPGVSDVFKMGRVTYSNKAKRKHLGVKKSTLDKYGAVSAETAAEMARGAAAVSKAACAISATGIAGPDGGTDTKPVGLVYFGCTIGKKTYVKECHFKGNRDKIREGATVSALSFLRSCLLNEYKEQTFGK